MANRSSLRGTAVRLLVELSKKERAGETTTRFYLDTVQPAVEAAVAAGCTITEVHAEADRQYGRWLIANAGR